MYRNISNVQQMNAAIQSACNFKVPAHKTTQKAHCLSVAGIKLKGI
jgi:hypothetical protein